MSRSFPLFLLAVYGVGCVLSQSLMSLAGAVAALATLLCLPGALRSRKRWPRNEKIGLAAALVWLLFSVCNLLLRPHDDHTWHTLGELPLILVPALALSLRKEISPRDLRWPLSAIAAAVLLSFAASTWQYFVEGHVGYGFLANQIYYAYNLLPAFLLFAELFLRRLSFGFFTWRWAGAVGLLRLAEMLMANTRMIWAGALLYLLLRAAPLMWRRYGARRVAMGIVMASLLGAAAYATLPMVRARVTQTLNSADNNTQSRFVIWRYNWNLFLKAPFFGSGAERNAVNTAETPEIGWFIPGFRHFAHNIFLQSLADSGITGTALFLAFWIAMGLSFRICAVMLPFIAFTGLSENIFNNSKATHAVYFFTLMAALISRTTSPAGRRA